MKKHSEGVLTKHGEESFQGIFWSQQLKATAANNNGVCICIMSLVKLMKPSRI